MSKPGPKPKSTIEKLLDGNPGRTPILGDEPLCQLPPVKPSAVHMDEIASLEWDRLLNAMAPTLITALDVNVLATHVLAWSMLVKAQSDIDQNGITLDTKTTVLENGTPIVLERKPNPACRIWKAATETLKWTQANLGLSPTSRVGLRVPGGDPRHTIGGRFGHLLGGKGMRPKSLPEPHG